jgi:hypothetical protein
MTTRIGIDLPPDLLEAARISQSINRNRLLSRESINKTNTQIQQRISVLDDGLVEPWKSAVPEYKPPAIALSKTKNEFTWAATEEYFDRALAYDYAAPCSGITTGTKQYSFDYAFAIKQNKPKYLKTFRDQGEESQTRIGYHRSYDYSEQERLFDSQKGTIDTSDDMFNFENPPTQFTVVEEDDFIYPGSKTPIIKIDSDESRRLDFTITQQLSGLINTQTGENVWCSDWNPPRFVNPFYSINNFQSYKLSVYCSIPSRYKFLYVVWKETGSESFTFSGSKSSENRRGFDADGFNSTGSGLDYRNKRILHVRQFGPFPDVPILVGVTKILNSEYYEGSYYPPYDNLPVFSESLLPEDLRGFMTAVYRVSPRNDKRNQVFAVNFSANTHLDDISLNVTSTSIVSLQEKFLIFASKENYANI